MIFGRPGSGKSTFATWLSEVLGLPLYHLDKHFYVNDWVERDYSEFLQIQKNIVDTECWIVDGNNIRSLEMRWSRADLVIYFNMPKVICGQRIIKRFLKPNQSFDDRAPGCKEKISWRLFKYMWGFDKRVAQDITTLKQRYPHVVFKEIKNAHDLHQFNHQLSSTHHA